MTTELKDRLQQLSPLYYKNYLASISIDCVIFSFDTNSLKVLLLRLKDFKKWSLPGGYLRKDEDLNAGALRVLEERTSVSNIYLHQFETFGKKDRSQDFFKGYPDDLWHKQRYISISYYALTNYAKVIPKVDQFSEACEWKSINELPELMMDHSLIVEEAIKALRRGLNYRPIGLKLLPEKFTMPELQKLYEIILGKKLNRGNFYRKMLKYGILNKLEETRKGGAHKAPNLYTFNEEAYSDALENGFKEAW